ncbi:hypothetical protein NSU_1363 [Novosphingobium pentaromativorans US6-1]|uniref:Uncharacterized protein n=2 Tax=Novosphingobium TaxID=165696 RepID=G6EAG5_9SPHN|nr:hypothetical protein NSU_1363 [Novosphingobium pentaromativorans US6-1]
MGRSARPRDRGRKDARMPLWLEMAVSVLLTYCVGFGIGWLLWNRKG